MHPTQSDSRTHHDHHPRNRRRAANALLAVLLLTATSAACSSSKSTSSASSASASASASASSSASTSTGASSSASAGASATGTAPADPVAATAAVKTNWEKFFDPATPLTAKAALLENGDQLMPLLQGFAQDPRVGQVKAQVNNVAFTSPTNATVTYALSLQGNVVEPAATGTAILDNGTWKVSRSTLCGLVTQSGNTGLPGCA
ncbi:hypothetical protein [Kitasatospora sp. MAP5-34]|uniref:hypothetical protein n=1 Tax=Kitasatospora sp. MAP5-34 TaxID=3035102 RepID=UPI00247419D0|nr:hypothetical protein [Kitasatospora sp. MAP5-34]MDH6576841.1 cytoskeletal protein RodZ [Kitasatospora sp. MAP5-34]